MEITIDALGDKCPVPVIKAKKALSSLDEVTVEMLVDNETSVHNLESLAKSLNCAVAVESKDDGTFSVVIAKEKGAASEGDGAAPTASGAAGGPRVVVFPSPVMGHGDDELGATLIKAFVFSLTQQDDLPDTLLFYNGGVKLTCEGSPVLDDLKKLAEAGVEIMSCGTCLNYYGLTEKLQVGEVTNMYVIVEKQLHAGVVVRP